ncbi:MAG TPA: AAA family ATPase, partial [Candidatus Saccharimonadales bacterium]|nr:AAA family ATPase [Candidatus Saccharimonadales bacterium]
MTLAPQELENTASKFAAEAIKLDSQGSHSSAINSYQRASEALIKLVQIYPEYKLNRVYLERASAYQNRIKAIQMANGILEEDKRQNYSVPDLKEPLVNDKETPTMSSKFISSTHHHKINNSPNNTNTIDSRSRSTTSSQNTNMIQELSKELENLILKEKPKVTWKEVIGLEDAKRAIRESIVYPTKRADLFPLGWPRGILLFGPPGCGKTLLAAAAAAE